MSFRVQVGPPQIAIHQGQTVLVTDTDGQVAWPSDKGLYFLDTRVISAWAIYANGQGWDLLNGGAVTFFSSRVFLANQGFETQDGAVPPRTLELIVSRSLSGGLHEDLDLTNYGQKEVSFNLEIAVRSDFADIFEVKSDKIVRRGKITTAWSEGHQQLRTLYTNEDFRRGVTIRPHRADSRAVYANGRLSFDVTLAAGATWHACLLYELIDGGRKHEAPRDCTVTASDRNISRIRSRGRTRCCGSKPAMRSFTGCSARRSTTWLRCGCRSASTSHMVFMPAAGLPWFMAPFGRDSLIVSLQNMLIFPDFARGALDILVSFRRASGTTGATPSRAKSCTSCVTASSRISNSFRTRPITAPPTRRCCSDRAA